VTSRFRAPELIRIAVAVIAAAIAAACAVAPNSNGFDYAQYVITAQRILNGERPYVDFYVSYGPLAHYQTSAAVWLLHSMPAASAINILFAVCAVAYFAISGIYAKGLYRESPGYFAGYCAVLLASAPVIGSYSYYSLLTLLCVVVSFPLVDIAASGRDVRTRVLAAAAVGALSAVAFLDRFNFGVYMIAAVTVGGIIALIFRRKSTAAAFFLAVAIAFVTLAVFLACFWPSGIASRYIRDLPGFVSQSLDARAIPYRLIAHRIILKLAALGAAIVAFRALLLLLRGEVDSRVVKCGITLCFFIYSLYRFDIEHIVPFFALSALLIRDHDVKVVSDATDARLLTFLPRIPAILWTSGALTSRAALVVILLISYVLLDSRGVVRSRLNDLSGGPLVQHGTKREGMYVSRAEATMLDKLDRLRQPGETVFWAPVAGSCESTFHACVNLALYVAERTVPTPWMWYFDPTFTASGEMQRGILSDLERQKTVWIGMQGLLADAEPRGKIREATVLQDYVRANYIESFTESFPELNRYYVIYRRRSDPLMRLPSAP
jgi:hypothetical protein